MRYDEWELLGLFGEGLFFARMVAQWLASERQGRPVVPTLYWLLSLAGAGILICYAVHLGSFAVLLPQVIGIVFYVRGWQLDCRGRRKAGTAPRSWPSLSIIVPVHNEAAALPAALESLAAQAYPGPGPEIIVALNGCSDESSRVAEQFAQKHSIRLIEDARSGMSFGKNLGARAAENDILVFVDADTRLPPDGLRRLAEAAAGRDRLAGTVAGAPDQGGGVVRIAFWLANLLVRRRKAHAPGGVIFIDRGTFAAIGGFDENLPQGTSTDCLWRAVETGAAYVFVDSFRAVTSIRRFRKTGVVRQMFAWRRNHRDLAAGRRAGVAARDYGAER
ncbi:MAG: lipid-A-disaccharide synthase N-terminal domain-containing protein [Planctomycetota bacterium]|jgi:lipid-A-disaccharide synthase-like uncharacterized protein|nr:lipid-A-disaccharide synthase N-terminal domain-containing protein [Planctomycetota bacterium]